MTKNNIFIYNMIHVTWNSGGAKLLLTSRTYKLIYVFCLKKTKKKQKTKKQIEGRGGVERRPHGQRSQQVWSIAKTTSFPETRTVADICGRLPPPSTWRLSSGGRTASSFPPGTSFKNTTSLTRSLPFLLRYPLPSILSLSCPYLLKISWSSFGFHRITVDLAETCFQKIYSEKLFFKNNY